MESDTPTKLFRVDKAIVIKSTLPWAIGLSVALLLLMHNLALTITLADSQFWGIVAVIWGTKVALDLWTISYDRIEIGGTTVTSHFNGVESGDIRDFVSARQIKTIYTNYLGFDYREPKGNFVRYLLPYGYYSPRTLQSIMQEILRINPHITLEDDLAKQIAAGTYKSELLG